MDFCYNTFMEKSEFSNGSPEQIESNKRDLYEKLCEGEPNAIFVFGGAIVMNEATGEYKSGSYGDPDPHGLLAGSKARSIAAAELHEQFPDSKVVATSTIPSRNGEPEKPFAEVTAKELEHYGVESENIVEYPDPYSTFTELIGLMKLAVENKWEHLVVITNEAQVGRTKLLLERIGSIKNNNESYQKAWQDSDMVNEFEKYKELNPKVVVVAAESILPIRDERYSKLLEQVRNNELYRKRVESETKAEKDILDGTYGKQVNKPESFIEHS